MNFVGAGGDSTGKLRVAVYARYSKKEQDQTKRNRCDSRLLGIDGNSGEPFVNLNTREFHSSVITRLPSPISGAE